MVGSDDSYGDPKAATRRLSYHLTENAMILTVHYDHNDHTTTDRASL